MTETIKRESSFFSDRRISLFVLIILVVCYFVYFKDLGKMTVRMWDEARVAINAFEMTQNGNWLVAHYNGRPDMWSTKPPLQIWLVALFMKLMGPTELALRLPSAISATCTVFVLFMFGTRYLKDMDAGFASAMILIASMGYADWHIATTGDRDSLLVLWTTLGSLLYFIYVQDMDGKKKLIYPVVIFFTLAVLTKGIGGLLLLPGLFLYTLYRRRLRAVIGARDFWKALPIFLIVVPAYYLGREYVNPGYIRAVINNETLRRYITLVDASQHSYWFYLKHLCNWRLIPWIFMLPFSVVVTVLSRKDEVRKFSIFCLFYLIPFFLVISGSDTKQLWYDAPIYPITSLLVGISLVEIFNLTAGRIIPKNLSVSIVLPLYILVIVSLPTLWVYNYIHRPSHANIAPAIDYGGFLRKITEEDSGLRKLSFINEGYNAHLLFYVEIENANGYKIKIKSLKDDLNESEVVVGCGTDIRKAIEQRYATEILRSGRDCTVFRVEQQIRATSRHN